MNLNEANDVREMTAGELDEVSGAMPFLAAAWIGFAVIAGGALALGIGASGTGFGGGTTRDFNEWVSEMPPLI